MHITKTPDVAVPPRRFVPDSFDPTQLDQVRERIDALLGRICELEEFLRDASELLGRMAAARARRRIAMTRNTVDGDIRAHLEQFEQEVWPEWRRLEETVRRHYLAHPGRATLHERFRPLDERIRNEADLFRDENVPRIARDEQLRTSYARQMGRRRIPFRGESLTPQQLRMHFDDHDRATREEAYRAMTRVAREEAADLDGLLDEMLAVRGQIAAGAGLADYRDYAFRERERFSYGVEDCFAFHDAVDSVVVPHARALDARHAARLGLEQLRPWDAGYDGREPLHPFSTEEEFVALGQRLFEAVDPELAAQFLTLQRNGLLDLMSRPGKAPGGYNYMIGDIALPFIFANAAGTHGDLRTLTHEGGHAFHSFAVRDDPYFALTKPPMEFCEVASMAMELFAMEHFDAIFSPEDARYAARALLEQRLALPAWVATVDAFQHWLYLHPGHTREERHGHWTALRTRFGPRHDFTGLEDFRKIAWQGQGHIYKSPFYYIDYAIALLGALQLWLRYREDPSGTVKAYRRALSLGGTRSLPELFEAAGIRFAMDEAMLREVMDPLAERIRELEEPG